MILNSKEWVRQLIQMDMNKALPIVAYPGLHFTGKRVIDLVTNEENQAECIEIPAKLFPSAAGAIVMDLSVEDEPLGSPVFFNSDEVPTISFNIICDAHSIEKLDVPEVGVACTYEFIKAASITTKKIPDMPVFSGMIGSYSLTGRFYDFLEVMPSDVMVIENLDIAFKCGKSFFCKIENNGDA